jgi:hypothetical protein
MSDVLDKIINAGLAGHTSGRPAVARPEFGGGKAGRKKHPRVVGKGYVVKPPSKPKK